MHGAAQMGTFIGWWMGATIVYVRKFDAAEVWRTIEREGVKIRKFRVYRCYNFRGMTRPARHQQY